MDLIGIQNGSLFLFLRKKIIFLNLKLKCTGLGFIDYVNCDIIIRHDYCNYVITDVIKWNHIEPSQKGILFLTQLRSEITIFFSEVFWWHQHSPLATGVSNIQMSAVTNVVCKDLFTIHLLVKWILALRLYLFTNLIMIYF